MYAGMGGRLCLHDLTPSLPSHPLGEDGKTWRQSTQHTEMHCACAELSCACMCLSVLTVNYVCEHACVCVHVCVFVAVHTQCDCLCLPTESALVPQKQDPQYHS